MSKLNKKISKIITFVLAFFLVNINVLASGEYTNVKDIESLKAAITNGENVKLTGSFELSETIKMTSQDITLDLNGYTITGKDNVTSGNFNLIEVIKGNFTIIDSKEKGAITLKAAADRNWDGMSTIIENRGGVVNIESGTIKHLGGSDMAYAINVNANLYGDATLNVKGGTLYSTYTAIRLYMSSTAKSYLNVTGGSIDGGTSAIWAQAPESTAGQTSEINITSGKLGIINTARGTTSTVSTKVSGGTVKGIKAEAGELKISGGHISDSLTILNENNEIVEKDDIITGGTFGFNPSGYIDSNVSTTSIVTNSNKVTYVVGETEVKNTASSAVSGSTVIISGNIELNNVQYGVSLKADSNSTVTANGVVVPEEGITIEDPSKKEEPKKEKFCPNDSKISIQTCIDGGTSEESCIKKLCPGTEIVENPKTGSYISLVVISIIIVIASAIYASTRNRNYFSQIK